MNSQRTNGTFGFARHTSRPFAKPKELFSCQRTYDDNATIKLNLADIKNFKY